MRTRSDEYCFQQIHIDAARNATDDFNPFHDQNKWNRVRDNPFGMPIALGFQLEALIEYLMARFREQAGESTLLSGNRLDYTNFQLTFTDVVRPGEPFHVEIKKTVNRIDQSGELVNRIAVKKAGGLVLLGYQRESRTPQCMPDADLSGLENLDAVPDRSPIAHNRYFMKRKFMNTGHAKNFLAGSLVDQHYYFDELEERVRFPAMFPAALLSCALLEKARSEGYAFEANPLVYTSHLISVDRRLLDTLKSNDRLCLLVGGPEELAAAGKGLGHTGLRQQLYRCFGLLSGNRVLYRAEVALTPLTEILRATGQR